MQILKLKRYKIQNTFVHSQSIIVATHAILNRWSRSALMLSLAVAAVTYAICPAQPYAAELRANPSTYRADVARLKPGDRLALEPGTYTQGLPLHGLHGTPDQPIRIHGPAEGAPAVFIGQTGRNTISLSNTAHVHMSSLVLDGRGLEVDGIKAEGSRHCSYVHHIVVEDFLIIGHGADQQLVAISSLCPAWSWVVRGNVIVGAGTGLYLGQSDGSAPFVGGVIEQNLVIDTRGYNLQIKHQIARPAGVGMPPGQTRTVIRHNVFSKAANASSGANARPNVLLGHFPREGPGSEDVYEVKNNVFFCSPVESLLQAEGNLSIAGNAFINPAGHAVSIQPHHDMPRRLSVQQNFISASGHAISVSRASPRHRQSVADNRLFSPIALEGGQQHGNRVDAFPASRGDLIQWLRKQPNSTANFEGFAPLVRSVSRWCSGLENGRLTDFQRVHDQLRDHPVCGLVELFSTAPRKSLPVAAPSEPIGLANADRCTWN